MVRGKTASLGSALLQNKEPSIATDSEQDPVRVGLNFSIHPDFRKELKSWCVAHDMKLVDFLKRSFDLMRREYGD